MQYQKTKSVAKSVTTHEDGLDAKVLSTMKRISAIVGATLGPSGRPVLIERQEFDLPAMVTKDGVTVFRSLGFQDPVAHLIMETARDASLRTASEAGDGTTTATILTESIVRRTHEFCKKNPKVSPQRVVRRLETIFRDVIEPSIHKLAMKADLSTESGKKLLHSVAKISANGDSDLADAVMECYELVGDEGNVTLTEISGPSHYEVERLEGYPVYMGYEDSCAKFKDKFINDPGLQRCMLENPLFAVYHGRITDIQTIQMLMESVADAWQNPETANSESRHNVVLVATGFSESVLANLGVNFQAMTSINVFPLLAPMSPVVNGQLGFLEDLCAVTGSRLLDPLNCPFDQATVEDLGRQAKTFESSRFRSTVSWDLTPENEMAIQLQVDKLTANITQAPSLLDKSFLEERIGKLTGGIAKLKVIGASNGELREKRDRAEDAVCAVRGAIKHGCLPGGGWTLLKLVSELDTKDADSIVKEVLIPALQEPFERLLTNCGMTTEEISVIKERVTDAIVKGFAKSDVKKALVYDAMDHKFVEPIAGEVLDSTPAVLEAIRTSISNAANLGTLGGIVAFGRDLEMERSEARDTNAFIRDSNVNPADERA